MGHGSRASGVGSELLLGERERQAEEAFGSGQTSARAQSQSLQERGIFLKSLAAPIC